MRPLFELLGAPVLAAGAALTAPWVTEAQLVERSAYLMGTRATLSVLAATRAEGLALLDAAVVAIEQTEQRLSTWRADSAVSAINRAPLGAPNALEPALCRVLAVLQDWHEWSAGAFDPAIGTLVRAWDLHGDGRVASDEDLSAALASSGFRHLDLDRSSCIVTRRRAVAIDAGGFGKGEALDRAAEALAGASWMIDFGGQVSVGQARPGQRAWVVSVADPLDRQRRTLDIGLTIGSLATSGGSEQDLFVGGSRIGHILDPRTGRPASFRGSVSVWHSSALVADILSTALYVMGPVDGVRWAESLGLAACYLEPVAGDIARHMTTRFAELLR